MGSVLVSQQQPNAIYLVLFADDDEELIEGALWRLFTFMLLLLLFADFEGEKKRGAAILADVAVGNLLPLFGDSLPLPLPMVG